MVDILLSLLGSGSNLKFTFLHWLSVTVLLLRGDGELICELLAVFRVAGFTELLMDLSWSIIALLGWNLITVYRSLTIKILELATLKVNRIDTRPVLDNLILIPAILVREINTLVI